MADIVCIKCQYIGRAKKKKRGNTKTEAIGWAFFPLGLPYTIWRMFSKKRICPNCENDFIISADSVAGQRLVLIAAGEDPNPIILPNKQEIKPQASEQSVEQKSKPYQDPNLW